MRNPKHNQSPNILDMFTELNQTRASVAQLASQIIAQLQPLTVIDTAIGPMANGQHRLTAVMRRGGYKLAKAPASAPANGKKRRKRVEITPAMRKMVLDMSKNPENNAPTIAKAVGISIPSVFNIRKEAKKKKKRPAKTKAPAPASAK